MSRFIPGPKRRMTVQERRSPSAMSFETLEMRHLLTVVLDPTFDADGLVTTRFNGGEEAHAVAMQKLGAFPQIIIAGSAFVTSGNEFAVARLNLDGSVDTTFGNNGLATAGFPSLLGATDLAVQPDGKIVTVGAASGHVLGREDFAIARFNANGTLDQTFGRRGATTTNILAIGNFSDQAYGVALQLRRTSMAALIRRMP